MTLPFAGGRVIGRIALVALAMWLGLGTAQAQQGDCPTAAAVPPDRQLVVRLDDGSQVVLVGSEGRLVAWETRDPGGAVIQYQAFDGILIQRARVRTPGRAPVDQFNEGDQTPESVSDRLRAGETVEIEARSTIGDQTQRGRTRLSLGREEPLAIGGCSYRALILTREARLESGQRTLARWHFVPALRLYVAFDTETTPPNGEPSRRVRRPVAVGLEPRS
jgi:hypothetical protein